MIEKTCSFCGKRLSDFYKDGMLGCPNCYNAFNSEIISSLKNFQGDSFHIGKEPKCSNLDKQLYSEYQKLIHEREKAGIDGRFHDMAELSKSISELSVELKERGLI